MNMDKKRGYLFCCNCGYYFDSDCVFVKNLGVNSFGLCRNCVLELLKDCAQFAAETAKNEQEQDFFSMVDSKIKHDKKKEKYSFTENW